MNPLKNSAHYFAELLNIAPVAGLYVTIVCGVLIFGVILFTCEALFKGK